MKRGFEGGVVEVNDGGWGRGGLGENGNGLRMVKMSLKQLLQVLALGTALGTFFCVSVWWADQQMDVERSAAQEWAGLLSLTGLMYFSAYCLLVHKHKVHEKQIRLVDSEGRTLTDIGFGIKVRATYAALGVFGLSGIFILVCLVVIMLRMSKVSYSLGVVIRNSCDEPLAVSFVNDSGQVDVVIEGHASERIVLAEGDDTPHVNRTWDLLVVRVESGSYAWRSVTVGELLEGSREFELKCCEDWGAGPEMIEVPRSNGGA